jgi:hypothetical protein
MKQLKRKKAAKFTAKYLDNLIEAAIIDAYNKSEQVSGFFTLVEEHLVVPLTTRVLGRVITVTGVDTLKAIKSSLFARAETQSRQSR